MATHLQPLHEALAALAAVWGAADDATHLTRTQLVAANEALGVLRRRIDGIHAEVAAGIARESRAELGPESLAKQQGYRNPATLIAAATGSSTGDAVRLTKVGEATAPRSDLVGARLPAMYPMVQQALATGELSVAAAGLIIGLLDRTRLVAGAERIAQAEQILVEKVPGMSLDDVRKLIVRAEAWLDPDGVEPRLEDARAQRSATMFERDGRFHLNLVTDVESAAAIRAAVTGYVSAAFAARKDAVDSDAPDADRRTVPMLQADALTAICQHALGCQGDELPSAGATVIVRVDLADLTSGTGFATIDGMDQPIDIGAVRRMAASGGVIPCVLGEDSEILDWGREKRLFTRAQKLALAERDGGCAMCHLPPDMARAHHIRWWTRDAGPTDLGNGVLLCETCHHRIHDNGWEVRVDGVGPTERVWFIPPPWIDPRQTPRLGGRARYDLVA